MTEENPDEETPQALDLTVLELDQLLGIFIDLVKAAAAIDLVTVMVDKVAPFLDEDDVGRLRSMIADLQLNYARQA